MNINVPSLSKLIFLEFEGSSVLPLDDFLSFLKANQSKGSDRTQIRKTNIVREFEHHVPCGLVEVGCEQCVQFQSLLKYFINHCNDFEICRKVCKEISKILTRNVPLIDHSILSLYQAIAGSSLRLTALESMLQNILDDLEPGLNLLYGDYKGQFSDTEWKRIILFEWHFGRSFPNLSEATEYQKLLDAKWSFFLECKSAKDMGIHIQSACSDVIRENQKREAASEALNDVVFEIDGIKHRCGSLEDQLRDEVDSCTPSQQANFIDRIICVGCGAMCTTHDSGVHVIIETSARIESDLESLVRLVQSFLQTRHSITNIEIVFVTSGALGSYVLSGRPQRFTLYDNLFKCVLSEFHIKTVLITDSAKDADVPCQAHNNLCLSCFKDHVGVGDPLDYRSFNLLKEWFLHVPLQLQYLLENAFLNIDSIRRMSGDISSFLTTKLAKMYVQVEGCYSVLNKKYKGILQKANTDELMLHYHHPTTVLGITSQFGISASHKTAERRLEKLSDPDMCYYNSFVKEHPMEYQSIREVEKQSKPVSIRACHTIFQVDNLVRWGFRTDPKPNEDRAVQIDTLPMTVKGIPKDSTDVEKWHLSSCEGGDHCSCKDPVVLEKSDVDKVLFTLNAEEEKALEAFRVKANWGINTVYGMLKGEPDFNQLLEESCPDPDDDIEALNKTIEYLKITDDDENDLDVDDATLLDEFKYLLTSPGEEDESSLLLDDAVDDGHASDDSETSDMQGHDLSFDSDSDSECLHSDDDDDDSVLSDVQPLLLDFDISDLGVAEMSNDTINTCDVEVDMVDHLEEMSVNQAMQHSKISMPCRPTNGLELADRSSSNLPRDENLSPGTSVDHTNLENSSILQNKPFKVPPLLCRHPPPATGRDDDIQNLKKVLDDLIVKLGASSSKDRVLCAADFKIAKNIFLLRETDPKYSVFLCEFPLLHLRKSKITNLVTAYKDAGILHLLKYMKDDDKEKEWTKLLSIGNIETATRYIWRLSTALHLAFFIKFHHSLGTSESSSLKEDLSTSSQLDLYRKWGKALGQFIEDAAKKNATFGLHRDIMTHCDEIVAIAISERIGGPEGYNLLLSVVKSSLPFSFLNTATSYAGFCVLLLIEHYSAGAFHHSLKQTLFTTPHRNSLINFALDTQREMDHREAARAFRPGSTMNAITTRMSVVDAVSEVHQLRKYMLSGDDNNNIIKTTSEVEETTGAADTYMGKSVTPNDLEHMVRTLRLILRRDGLSTKEDVQPINVYAKITKVLPEAVLDEKSFSCGQFLIRRFVCQKKLISMSSEDTPDIAEVEGPKSLVQKLKKAKGVTISRTKGQASQKEKTEAEKSELKRVQQVKRQAKIADCKLSSQNACQAVVRPNRTKSGTNKSAGMKQALKSLLKTCGIEDTSDLISENADQLPDNVVAHAKVSIIEFAGLKFKTFAETGHSYMENIQRFLKKIHFKMPHLHHVVICEEKYSYTPDDFKAATRAKRQAKETLDIYHLREGEEILSNSNFRKSSVLGTAEGKSLVSKYLGDHIHELTLQASLTVDIDSEANISPCSCHSSPCWCARYAIPTRAEFSRDVGLVSVRPLAVKQRKGEAEMSQVDWLPEVISDLGENDIVVNYVTSADIDTVYIHLFAVSLHWPRNEDGTFKWPIYLWLQKSKSDLFNITSMIRIIEEHFSQVPFIAATIAVALCMGGNDFLPKLHSVTHDRLLKTLVGNPELLLNLILYKTDPSSGQVIDASVNRATYEDLIKQVYCPLSLDHSKLTLEEVRQYSIKRPGKKDMQHPQSWMPPLSALHQICHLIDSQIEYLMTAWDHSADLPDFLSKGCLQKDGQSDEIYYYLGPDEQFKEETTLLTIGDKVLEEKIQAAKKRAKRKRNDDDTPQKGLNRKRQGHLMSTPVKLN